MRWIFLLFVLVPSTILADGGLFPGIPPIPPPEIEIWEPNQLAILKHSEGFEELSIVVKFEGNVNDFAWVIPAPSQPSVDDVSHEVFDELAYLSRPIYRDRGAGCGCEDGGGWLYPFGGREGSSDYEERVDEVEIVGEGTVGLLHYLILHATNAGVLQDSLESWGYHYPEEAESLFDYYIAKEWEYFVTARVDTSGIGGNSGHYYGNLQPIKLSFESDEPVYPMKISSLSSQGTELILYVVTDHRMTFEKSTIRFANKLTEEELDGIGEQYPHLSEVFDEPCFLTKLERYLTPSQMEDITPEQAEDDQEYREIIFTGVPGDGLIFAPLFLIFALWSIRKRRVNRSGDVA